VEYLMAQPLQLASIEEKEQQIRQLFACCSDAESRYQKIIEIGRSALSLPDCYKSLENRVSGCQSTLYLHAAWQGEQIIFLAESDALISQGLAQLLTCVYSQEVPEVILRHEPKYLEELGIPASLSLTRAHGLASLYLHMKRRVVELVMQKETPPTAACPSC
jgi:cysteine desulfuration protein SufE